MREFSGKEKELIREKLMSNAKRSFSKYGIKKTSIEELTRSAGIAKGSFYLFFQSKEELYMELLMNEIAASMTIMPNVQKQSFQLQFRNFLKDAVDSMYSNPILKLMLIPEEYNLVYRKMTLQEENTIPVDIVAPLTGLIAAWQSKGVIINTDASVLANVIKCLFLLTTHREEIGEDDFLKVMDFMIDMTADQLTNSVDQQ